VIGRFVIDGGEGEFNRANVFAMVAVDAPAAPRLNADVLLLIGAPVDEFPAAGAALEKAL
jgi:hypothetical protein